VSPVGSFFYHSREFSEVQPNPFSQAQSLNSQLIQLRARSASETRWSARNHLRPVTSMLVRKFMIVKSMR